MKEEKASGELNLNELFLSVAHFTLSPTAANAENLCLRQQTSEWVGKNCLLRHLVLKEVIGDLEGKKILTTFYSLFSQLRSQLMINESC